MTQDTKNALQLLRLYGNKYAKCGKFESDMTPVLVEAQIKTSCNLLAKALKNEQNTNKLLEKLETSQDTICLLKEDIRSYKSEIKKLNKLCKTVSRYPKFFAIDDIRDGGYFYCPACESHILSVNNVFQKLTEEEKISKCPKCKQALKWRKTW